MNKAIEELCRGLQARETTTRMELYEKGELVTWTGLDGVTWRATGWGEGLDLFPLGPIAPNAAIDSTLGAKVSGSTSDGYHTFDELYEHRTGLLAALCNSCVAVMECCGSTDISGRIFKSHRHHDGEMLEGYFIVGVNCKREEKDPDLWATWHCQEKWWCQFMVPVVERAPEWDGHTPSEALQRLINKFGAGCFGGE